MIKSPSRLTQLIASVSLAIVVLSSCESPLDRVNTDPSFDLRFSSDTVFFDTIFTELKSVTRRLRVYNNNPATIEIESIALRGVDTPYNITVNGREGKAFEKTRLLGNDSMMVLIDVTIDPQNQDLPYVVEDQIDFVTNGNEQKVELVSWGQDAHYLRDSILACNTVFTAGRPYVIYDHILVDSLCTLTVEPGARIFSHSGSNIYVKGSIQAVGTPENPILFTNDRFDPVFVDLAGQWGSIIFLEGSKNNHFKQTTIRNGQNGLWLGTPDADQDWDIVIEESTIENCSGSGILAFTSDLSMTNVVVNNCGQLAVAMLAGGNYEMKHCTIANYGFGFFKQDPAFAVSNAFELADGNILAADLNMTVDNCIIWGIDNEEIVLQSLEEVAFDLNIANSILKTSNEDLDVNNNLLNLDPEFFDAQSFDYRLDSISPALEMAPEIGVLLDRLGDDRPAKPAIGAHEVVKN